jgi:hypothetical protein
MGPVGAEAKRLRPLLAENGRLGLTAVVKVGRHPSAEAVEAWERRLEVPVLMPREALLALEAEGFEPELVETADAPELEEHYTSLEAALAKVEAPDAEGPTAARAELELYRRLGPGGGVTFAFVVGRRKEPGEAPPMSRDSG